VGEFFGVLIRLVRLFSWSAHPLSLYALPFRRERATIPSSVVFSFFFENPFLLLPKDISVASFLVFRNLTS